MKKVVELFKKYNFVILIVVISILRFLLSYKLPSFYLSNLKYDDKLMVNQLLTLMKDRYFGIYSQYTLIKGPIFPYVMYAAKDLNISFSSLFTLLYIFSSLFFATSMRKIINNKKFFLILYLILILNPLTYSAEVFQRLYANTISIPELLFFFGFVVNIIALKDVRIRDCIGLGLMTALMLLTRNDNIWIIIVIALVFIYKLLKAKQLENFYIVLFPILIVIFAFQIVSSNNSTYYKIYTYNELENTHFKDAYSKILQIKDDNKRNRVSIPKTTFLKLSEKSKVFGLTKEEIEEQYRLTQKDEIENGDIIWFFRFITYGKHKFKNGKAADKYYKKLSKVIDELFASKELKKEGVLPSVYLNSANRKELLALPKRFFEAIGYTSSYQNVRTYSKEELHKKKAMYNAKIDTYSMTYKNYRYAENIITKNTFLAELMRVIYQLFTIIFSIIALIIYFKNIKKFDELGFIIHLILLVYLIILAGVVYTDVTGFHAIRYRYLCNVYILQSLFIILNLGRLYLNRVEEDEIKFANMSDKLLKKLTGVKLSVVIPAYNEEKVISSTIKEVNSVLKKNDILKGSEIIVVNDGSVDKTGDIAKKNGAIVIDNPENMGYGYSLKRGIETAKNELIAITDADGTYPFNYIPKMIEVKNQGFDLVVGARCGKYYRQSLFKSMLRKVLKGLVEFVSDREIEDVNSGLRVFDKSTVIEYFPRLCNTFSFSTSETLAYAMNCHTITYVNVPYQKRVGKSKIKLFKDSMKSLRYILESCIYYNPLRIFSFLTSCCILLSIIGFICSHFLRIKAGYILGIGGLLVSVVVFSIGLLAVLLKQIMDK